MKCATIRHFVHLAMTALLLSGLSAQAGQGHAAELTNLRCEYLDNPLGIDAVHPRLSWVIKERGQRSVVRNKAPIRSWWHPHRNSWPKTVAICGTVERCHQTRASRWSTRVSLWIRRGSVTGKCGHGSRAMIRYDSVHGKISSAWKLEAGKLTMDVTVPANTTATVSVPATVKPGEDGPAADAASVTESGKPAGQAQGVTFLLMADGAAVYEIGSGSYHFERFGK